MTSFRKRTMQKPIPGTRTSPHTGQVITSSGNPSLDVILGGGLPIGSICLIAFKMFFCPEEDRFMTHAKVLAKYFLAEGVVSKQEIFLGSLDDLPAEMLRRLPKPMTDVEVARELLQEQKNGLHPNKNKLRIAFRYSDLPMVNSEQTTAKIGHHFNLMEHMHSMLSAHVNTWNDKKSNTEEYEDFGVAESNEAAQSFTGGNESSLGPTESMPVTYTLATKKDDLMILPLDVFLANERNEASEKDTLEHPSDADEANQPEGQSTANNNNNSTNNTVNNSTATTGNPQFFYNERYGRLLNYIQPLLNDSIFETCNNMQEKNMCRICLTSLGSPLWYDDHFGEDLLKFLTMLRGSVRSCTSVCFITMPMHLIAKYDSSLVPKIRQLVDYAIELESFAGSERETHPGFKEYSGLLHLHKMSAINTLAVHMPETTDLAFKLRRKKFVIEKLYLPPDLQETSGQAPEVDKKYGICSDSILNF